MAQKRDHGSANILRQRFSRKKTSSVAPSLAPSSSYSSLSSLSDAETKRKEDNLVTSQSFFSAFLAVLNPDRFATKSCLPWGHRPHPVIGISCLCYLLPVPFLWSCERFTALMFVAITATSYMSDHAHTGIDSPAHLCDRLLAPCMLVKAVYVVWTWCGVGWASSAMLAVLCHLLSKKAVKRKDYLWFVVWHSMWHFVGVALMVAGFSQVGLMSSCPENDGIAAFGGVSGMLQI